MKRISFCKLLIVLLLFPLVMGCYKEDVQELYSRQYVTSVNLRMLDDVADSLNNKINEIQKAVILLRDREVVSKLVYNVKDGDTLGATLTYDTLSTYIPFGRKGKDGRDGLNGKDGTPGRDGLNGKDGAPGRDGLNGKDGTPGRDGLNGKDGAPGRDGVVPTISIGSNGNWYINDSDTGKPSIGQKGDPGETPQISLRENPDDPNDKNIYWYIRFADGSGHFLLVNGEKIRANGLDGKRGEKGEPGVSGPPGVNSPITGISYGPGRKSLVITTTYPGLERVTIPMLNLRFDIQPERATITQIEAPDRFDVEKMELRFLPGETIVFPYTKDDDLESVYATLSNNWTVQIDQPNKLISITAPTVKELGYRDIEGTAVFYARTETGNTYTRNLNLKIQKKFEIGYFYRRNPERVTEKPSTRTNEIDLSGEMGDFVHYFILSSRNAADNYDKRIEGSLLKSPTVLTTELHKDDYFSFDKAPDFDNLEVRTIDYIYKQDSILHQRVGGDITAVDGNMLRPKNILPDNLSDKARYIDPLPWSTFGAYRVYQTTDRYLNTTTRLLRLPMKVTLHMFDPHKHLELAPDEEFDATRVVLYHATVWGLHANGSYMGSRIDGVTKAGQQVTKLFVARATNVAYFDKTKNILHGSFATGPVRTSSSIKLMIEYMRKDGSVVRKVLAVGNLMGSDGRGNPTRLVTSAPLPLPESGGEVVFSYQVPKSEDNLQLESYILSRKSNGNGSYRGNVLLTDVLVEDEF